MVNGLTIQDWVRCGYPMQDPILSPTPQTDIGFSPTMAGLGYPITIGAGLPSIMAVGIMKTVMVGCGFLVTIGGHLGSVGDITTVTTDGHQWDQASASTSVLVDNTTIRTIIGFLSETGISTDPIFAVTSSETTVVVKYLEIHK